MGFTVPCLCLSASYDSSELKSYFKVCCKGAVGCWTLFIHIYTYLGAVEKGRGDL